MTTKEIVITEFLNFRRQNLTEPKQTELAKKIGISKAMVSRYITELKETGDIPNIEDDIHVKAGRLRLLLQELKTPIFIQKQQGAFVSITKVEVDKNEKSIIVK